MGYKSKNQKEFGCKIVELEPKNIGYEKSCEKSKGIISQDNVEHETLSLERLFPNIVSSNMVEIVETYHEVLEKIYFHWSRSDEFETSSPISSSSSSSYFMVDEDTVDFTLISKQPTIQDFKDIDTILQISKFTINTTLEDQNLGEEEEYNINEKN